MNTNSNTKSFGQSLSQGGLGKGIAFLGCLGVLVLVLVIIILGGYVYINGNAASQSEIFFRSPMDGERVDADQPMQVRVLARDVNKILRIELWADGQLVETQSSTIPGGSNPFPLLTTWNPKAGTHTLIARSVNSKNESAQTTISIEATSLADADADGVSDATDTCPDQAGSSSAGGCPDRDADGIPDSTDTCPDVAGLPESGCPAPGEGDRDGDGTLDVADACPDDPGSPLADGCTDSDGDGIGDPTDACPGEPGVGVDGCSPPGDADADTVPDPDDACPHEWGLPERGGCPDVDGDGFIDSIDLCPAEPGTIDGCPEVAGGGVEPPPDDGDEGVSGDDGVFGDAGFDEAIDLIRIEALNFSVTQDYDEIYCYAGVVGRDMDQYGPFDSIGIHEWDIVEYMGGENTQTLGIVVGDPLVLRVECTGNRGDVDSFDLGSFTQSYGEDMWRGQVIQEDSGATGDPGHSFRMKFRLCYRTCDDADYPPPVLRHFTEAFGPWTVNFLGWDWLGDRADITGYKLYENGHWRETIHNPEASRLNLHDYMPSCGERSGFTLTAYQLEGITMRKSPPSNTVYIDGEPCPRRVRVTFEELGVSGLRTIGSDMDGRGPLYGSFWATGSDMETLDFDGGECNFLFCEGYEIFNGVTSINDMFAEIHSIDDGCIGFGCVDTSAPGVNSVIVELNEGDDLTIGGNIFDEERVGADEHLFEDMRTISADAPLPAEFTLEDHNFYGEFTLRVQIEEM